VSARQRTSLVHPREVESRLGVSRPTAIKLLRDGAIPGAMLMYRDKRGREHWRVEREQFELYLASCLLAAV
jgi:excisionase family DNA binding protein